MKSAIMLSTFTSFNSVLSIYLFCVYREQRGLVVNLEIQILSLLLHIRFSIYSDLSKSKSCSFWRRLLAPGLTPLEIKVFQLTAVACNRFYTIQPWQFSLLARSLAQVHEYAYISTVLSVIASVARPCWYVALRLCSLPRVTISSCSFLISLSSKSFEDW